jgi:hypothetical protein
MDFHLTQVTYRVEHIHYLTILILLLAGATTYYFVRKAR